MKNILILVIAISAVCSLKSQTYYDNKFHRVVNKSEASYYRIIDSTGNEMIERTYYINDTRYGIIHYAKVGDWVKKGKEYQFYKSGKLKYDIDFNNNSLNGYVKGYFENGNKKRLDFYKNDTLIEGKCFTESGLDTTYYIYERSASYKGQNLDYFRRFVESKLEYPPFAEENNIQGRVIVQFSVNSKGEVEDLYVVESPNDSLSKAAIKAIKKSGKWEPCIYEGEKARQNFIIPVVFLLN